MNQTVHKIGDVVRTGFYKGIWKVTDVQPAKNYSFPEYTIKQLVGNNYKKKNMTRKSWHSHTFWNPGVEIKILKEQISAIEKLAQENNIPIVIPADE